MNKKTNTEQGSFFWQAFERQVQKTPQHIALKNEQTSIPYQTLYRESRTLAYALKSKGLKPGDKVGIHYSRSCDFVLSVLACWYLGLVWCPLSQLPLKRRKAIENRIHMKLKLGNSLEDTHWQELTAAVSMIPDDFSVFEPPQNHPAYLIFTSGSSGKPKGVLVPHNALVDVFQTQIKALGLNADDRSLWVLSPLFDASISDLGTALLSGACLVIHENPLKNLNSFYRVLQQEQISYIDLPPSILAILNPEQVPETLKKILIGGEPPPVQAVRYWSQRLRLINVYGPTEASICTSLCLCSPDWSESILGNPLPGVRYRVVGHDGHEQQEGELWIHSPGLALEYWQNQTLSQTRFIHKENKRWYRSGDWVAKSPNGDYLFLGRIDRQIKHLGRLICPEEIESILKQCPEVSRVAVVLHTQGNLIAFLQSATQYDLSSRQTSQLNLLQQLKHTLLDQVPKWMNPDLMFFLETWPETNNGKTDFKRLHTWPIQANTPLEKNHFIPQNKTEEILSTVWKHIFCLEYLPLEPDFFRLGGNSIQILNMIAHASEYGLKIRPESVFQLRKLALLAQTLRPQNDQTKAPMPDQAQHTASGISLLDLLNTLPNLLPAAPKINTAQKKEHLLLTGSTGFLGSYLLAELLNQNSWRQITCLVRAQNTAHAQERITKALQTWQTQPDWQRIQAYPSDLCEPQLGVSQMTYQDIQSDVDAILHSAAQVDLIKDYQRLFEINTVALKHLYALHKPLHYISTLSVFVAQEPKPTFAREEKLLNQNNLNKLSNIKIYGGYAQSKWAAEAWLEQQQSQTEHPLWIYRPGLITGHSQSGQAPAQDWLGALITGLLEIGGLPELPQNQLEVDITPIDYAAQGILTLMQSKPGIYHLANPQSLSLNQFLLELSQWADLPILPLNQWQMLARQHLNRELNSSQSTVHLSSCASLLALSEILNPDNTQDWHALNLFQATGIHLASNKTEALLRRKNILCPKPNQELLRRYFNTYRRMHVC